MLCTIFPPFSPSYCTSHPPTPQYLISHSRHWVISSHLFPLLYICQPLTLFPSFRCFSPSIRRCLAQASFNGLNSSINYCWNFNSALLCNISPHFISGMIGFYLFPLLFPSSHGQNCYIGRECSDNLY